MTETRQRLPEWLKRGIVDTDKTRLVRDVLREKNLNTVCDSARCPNKNECYCNKTATFMILGNTCTRNCRFCAINTGIGEKLNAEEPKNVAIASKELCLEYVVITSVTRDDLKDGGAKHFSDTIKEIRNIDKNIKVEVLTPDFKGQKELIDIVIEANPDVFNHNVETVERLYKEVRPQANYERSLEFLRYIKSQNPEIKTKTGLMVGLGETFDELEQTFKDLSSINCDIVTIGQYIQPTKNNIAVKRYLKPEEYKELEVLAQHSGIKYTFFGPLVRSSYKAREVFD